MLMLTAHHIFIILKTASVSCKLILVRKDIMMRNGQVTSSVQPIFFIDCSKWLKETDVTSSTVCPCSDVVTVPAWTVIGLCEILEVYVTILSTLKCQAAFNNF